MFRTIRRNISELAHLRLANITLDETGKTKQKGKCSERNSIVVTALAFALLALLPSSAVLWWRFYPRELDGEKMLFLMTLLR